MRVLQRFSIHMPMVIHVVLYISLYIFIYIEIFISSEAGLTGFGVICRGQLTGMFSPPLGAFFHPYATDLPALRIWTFSLTQEWLLPEFFFTSSEITNPELQQVFDQHYVTGFHRTTNLAFGLWKIPHSQEKQYADFHELQNVSRWV